ncbi:MAG: hypothetical protein GC200_00560 [Tepidisphaera sp.]|nr:hypothetical protein [Tepidisphaera sp.]
MGRKHSTGNRYLRSGRRSKNGGAAGLLNLSGKAGQAQGLASRTERPLVEPLEPRQMLFSLTVTADSVDPATGIGTVRAYFGYALPILDSNFTPGTGTPTDIATDLTQVNPTPNLPSGVFLPANGNGSIQVVHNIQPPSDVSIQPPSTQQTDRWIRVVQDQVGEQIAYAYWSTPDSMTGRRMRRTTSQARVDIRAELTNDNTGLDTDRTIAELLDQNGAVVASFTGQALRNLISNNPGDNAALGIGTYTFNLASGFSQVRFRSTANSVQVNPAYRVTQVIFQEPAGNYQIPSQATYGAVAILSGPVGASATFRDLHGRDMVQTIAIGIPVGGTVPIITGADDGVPDFNDGIGSITLNGTDSRTAFTLWGITINSATTQSNTSDFFQNGFEATIVSTTQGLFNQWTSDGFGFISRVQNGQITVSGLPTGNGSVVVGSPFVRDSTSTQTYQPGRLPNIPGVIDQANRTVVSGYTRSDQGIFVNGSIGTVYVDGVVFGSSNIQGAVDKYAVGYQLGSLTVAGDAGQVIFGSDAGEWSPDPAFTGQQNQRVDDIYKTGSQLVVGRTLGEVAIAGRSLVDVTVIGDTSSPITRPARDNVNYYEREFVHPLGTTAQIRDVILSNLQNTNYVTRQPTDVFRNNDLAVVFGSTWYRNDSIMGAEWIGSSSSTVTVHGDLSGRNVTSAEDSADVYAFAADGSHDIVIEGSDASGNLYYRIVDQDGRTLAAPQQSQARQNGGGNTRFGSIEVRYRPTGPGVYYLVVSDPQGNDPNANLSSYAINVSGMATTSLGSYRTGAGSGFVNVNNTTPGGNSVNVLSGNIGSIRVGTGIATDMGMDSDPTGYINTSANANNVMTFSGGAITTPGTIYNITAGSDIGGPANPGGAARITVRAGGDLGTVYTGLSPAAGGSQLAQGGATPNQGDLNFITFNIGGRIGLIDVRGGIGMDQDETDPRAPLAPNTVTVSINTGTNGGSGDIGEFRVGFHVYGPSLQINTSPGSRIGAFLVSQDVYTDTADVRSGIYGSRPVSITTGAGSDVRFFDAPKIDTSASVDSRLDLVGSTPINIIDDGGARVQIYVENAPDNVVVGSVRVLSIDGSQGVAIGSITVDLSFGGILHISPMATTGGGGGGGAGGGGGSTTPTGIVSIGRIIITGTNPQSQVQITGDVKVDVYRITGVTGGAGGGGGGGAGGAALDRILNSTPGGDIVAIDVDSINTIDVYGNIGSTQLPVWGPTSIAPYLGLSGNLTTAVGDALGFSAAAGFLDNDASPTRIYRPINSDNFNGGNAYVDDVGSPIDGFLNGVVVRGGNVQEIRAKGSIGDIILEGATATLTLVNANSDNVASLNNFRGITGSIYAFDLGDIQIGDGLTGNSAPLATSGIFAANDILQIRSIRTTGAVISGIIDAANTVLNDKTGVATDGINNITVNSGSIRDAYIGSRNIDNFWISYNYGDDNANRGRISTININNGDLLSSTIAGANIGDVNITGRFDASTVEASTSINSVNATLGFSNSTLNGNLLSVRENMILVGSNIERITTTADISDLTITVLGDIRQNLTAINLLRSNVNVSGEIRGFNITRDVRASAVIAGSIPTVSIGNNLQSSNVTVSNTINTLTAGNRISDSIIALTGPDGSLGTITALTGIAGQISATGPIGTISVTGGDLTASITTTGPRGNVGTLTAAAGSVAITADISGNIGSIIAGRDIGTRGAAGVILVRGTLGSAAAPNGQLYSDLRVGGSIGTVTLGGAVDKPGNSQIGRGSIISFSTIGSVSVAGDFAGSVLSYTGGITSVAITNGSFLAGATVGAYDGSIGSFTITNGSLFGDVYADFDITALRVSGGTDGVFGDIGINPASSAAISYDANRNQLPPGVDQNADYQGPSIIAGRNITSIVVSNGSVFESSFFAKRVITSITITGDVRNDDLSAGIGSFFAAGDNIASVTITGNVSNTAFIAGVVSLGADNRPGGTGDKADVIKSGNISLVTINGSTTDSTFSAGINAGADGVYNTADDTTAQGFSTIATLALTGPVTNVSAFGDILAGSVNTDNRLIRGGTNLPNANPQIDSGSGTPGTSFSGSRTFNYGTGTVTINVSGPGQSFFNASTGLLTIRNGTGATNVTVSSSTGSLADFDIVTNDDASLGAITFQNTNLTGDSDIVVDGSVGAVSFANYSGTGSISIGDAAASFTFANFQGGSITARSAGSVRVSGDFATSSGSSKPTINLLTAGTISVGGRSTGNISVDRDIASVTLSGASTNTNVRAGSTLGSFTASAGTNSVVVAAGDSIGSVSVVGDASRSSFAAGVDLGSDAFFGGTGLAADTVSTGTIGSVNISGNIPSTSIVAGFNRGPDGYFGSSDDLIAPGRSTIGAVTIGGVVVGSTRNSEAYRIESTGTLGTVSIGGTIIGLGQTPGATNFQVAAPLPIPQPLQVSDLVVSVNSNTYSANIVFNQPINASTLSAALSVSEIRGSAGQTFITLVEGTDYTVSYNAANFTATVRFSRSITSRNLPQVPSQPGPGVYQFRLAANILRPQLVSQRLDGNGNGFTEATNDDYRGDAQIGDAGDKITPGVSTTTGGTRVDFYGPVNLNVVLDNHNTPDGLPEINTTTTIRGYIGDHPDNDTNFFRLAGDSDVYAVTLQAGQILRLGALSGAANRAGLTLIDSAGQAVTNLAPSNDAISLPTPTSDNLQQSFPANYLILTTGTYYIVVGSANSITSTATVNNPEIFVPGSIGDYNFSVEIFDDANSGFTSTTNAGNGTPVVNAPPPIQFAGTDGLFGTADDRSSIIVGNFTFTLNVGADGVPNTADDVVTGSNGNGVVSSRDAAGTLTNTISSAIGPTGHAGVPTDIFPDADVFHLNNRQAIAPGTHMRISVRLTDLGSILGAADPVTLADNRGTVQFGLFDTSNSTSVNDASLVFSPSDFKPFGGTPNTVIATNGSTTYGYDANGDFYIDFIAPSRQGQPGVAGTFAVYIQGSNNTDYQIVVTTAGTGQAIRSVQNVLIETEGGTINWLETGNATTQIAPLDVRALGFVGDANNGQTLQDYIVSSLISSLTSTFQNVSSPSGGLSFHFSSNPADFEGQPFSTIFLTSSSDVVTPLFQPFSGFNFSLLQANTFLNTQPYGYTQHSDPLNADLSDEGVVFIPTLALQGYGGGNAGANQLIQALTGAVGRRVGELVGLRVSSDNGTAATSFDPLAADSVTNRPGTSRNFTLSNTTRTLSNSFDTITNTDFFLGRQNARSLLDQIIQGL